MCMTYVVYNALPIVPHHSLGLKLGLTGNNDTQWLTLPGFEFKPRLAGQATMIYVNLFVICAPHIEVCTVVMRCAFLWWHLKHSTDFNTCYCFYCNFISFFISALLLLVLDRVYSRWIAGTSWVVTESGILPLMCVVLTCCHRYLHCLIRSPVLVLGK